MKPHTTYIRYAELADELRTFVKRYEHHARVPLVGRDGPDVFLAMDTLARAGLEDDPDHLAHLFGELVGCFLHCEGLSPTEIREDPSA